ncbi:hypothetical protein Misp01_03020 [Microtetraspora sp. NBRC 13810]|nr:hypothetical protein Misp01_03020 [Microtetraspora sp. NBRC 13810]
MRGVAELIRLDGPVDYLFFWGPRPAGSQARKGCLSQWWPGDFSVDGVVYRTAEHYMMAAKARLFGDGEMAAKIVAAGHPGEARALGRQVRGFDEDAWVAARSGVVVAGNLAKFGQHPAARDFLLRTGSRVLVEASPLDRIWGIGLAEDDSRAARPADWRGLNLLGFALMEVRQALAAAPR